MTEQAANMWLWTFVISGVLYLVAGWFMARWFGPAIGLGGPDDPRNGEEAHRG